jgi:hypothetical protein
VDPVTGPELAGALLTLTGAGISALLALLATRPNHSKVHAEDVTRELHERVIANLARDLEVYRSAPPTMPGEPMTHEPAYSVPPIEDQADPAVTAELEALHLEALGAPTIAEVIALAEARAVEDNDRRQQALDEAREAARSRRGAEVTLERLFAPPAPVVFDPARVRLLPNGSVVAENGVTLTPEERDWCDCRSAGRRCPHRHGSSGELVGMTPPRRPGPSPDANTGRRATPGEVALRELPAAYRISPYAKRAARNVAVGLLIILVTIVLIGFTFG